MLKTWISFFAEVGMLRYIMLFVVFIRLVQRL